MKTVLRKLSAVLVAVVAAAFVPAARGLQDPSQDEPIRLKTDLVTVTTAVNDREGRAIKSLKADDFTIYEDGVKQRIAHFAPTEEPFTLLLLLDISGSTLEEIALMKSAAKNFLAELRPNDHVGVIVFSREIEMISEFTDSRQQVEAAVGQIATPRGGDAYRFNSNTGTSFYDALYLAVQESPLKKVEGRKAIVCMSDGVDSTSRMKYKDARHLVEAAQAPIYMLELNTEEATLVDLLKPKTDPSYVNLSPGQIDRYYDEFDPDSMRRHMPRGIIPADTIREINEGLYKIARRELRELGEHTGGRVYPVRTLNDLSGVYKQVADDLRSQYSIGYYPMNNAQDGAWRSIRVEVRGPGAKVHARSGYQAPGK